MVNETTKVRVLMCGAREAFELKGNARSCSEEDIFELSARIAAWINDPANKANKVTAMKRRRPGAALVPQPGAVRRFSVVDNQRQLVRNIRKAIIVKIPMHQEWSLRKIAG